MDFKLNYKPPSFFKLNVMAVQKTKSNQNQPRIPQKIILSYLCALLFGTGMFYACEKEEEIEIIPIEIEAHIIHVTEFGGSDGIINLTVTGGIPPYSFLWSTNQTSEDLINISSGIYTVEVFDSKNHCRCDTFEITEPDPIPMTISFEVKNPTASGENNGSIYSSVEGGYPPFTWEWSNGATTKDIENATADTYIITVTDSLGRVLCDTITLTCGVTDIEGNVYNTVRIGDQIWLKENLRVKLAPDSSEITSYVYDDDPANEAVYGRLYTWDEAMNHSTQEKAQGICPDGWHIPGDEEFKKLEMYLGMTSEEADLSNTWRGAGIGTMLKYGGSSGFDILLSGRRAGNGSFSLLDRVEYLWTSTEYTNNFAWRRCFDKFANDVGRWNTFPKNYAFSVRCIKDDN